MLHCKPQTSARALDFTRSLGGGFVLNVYVEGQVIESSASEDCFMKRFYRLGNFILFVLAGVSALATPFVAHGQSASPVDVIKQAVAVVGGVEALRSVKGLSLKADAQFWEPQQSYVADGEPRFIGDSRLTLNWEGEKDMSRCDWDRKFEYPFVEEKKYSEIVGPRNGAVSTAKGEVPMSDIRVAAYRREFERASPILLLKALNAPQKLSSLPDQILDGKLLPSVAFSDGDFNFTILFDRSTKLPAAVRTRDDDWIYGDVNFDLVFGDWRSVDGIKIPYSQTYNVNNTVVGRIEYREVKINPSIAPDTFAIRDETRKDAITPALGSVPYQWVIRRLFLGRFLDSNAVNYPSPGTGLKLVELSPNVQFVTGGSHNSLIVARKDGLIVFDAPINEWQSRWTIDAAKAKYPGKPIKYLVLTHHHNDHTGGARTYVAEGASIIVAAPNKAHFETMFRAQHTMNPDELQKNPKPANIIEFDDHMTLEDEFGNIQLDKIANPHADGMLIGHLVNENIVWVTDLYSPIRDEDRSEMFVSFYEGLKKLGIAPGRIAGGHGGVVPASEMEAIMAKR
jgi:glyoxylase-like metal-dependent hydrolase (beta-lactamase superfamily II)